MNVKTKQTDRGFEQLTFTDAYDAPCSIQKSSLADEDAIWFGLTDADPKIMAKDTVEGGVGWVPYDIPDNVMLSTRMHLSQEQVKQLLPILQHFADTGELL